MNYIDLSHIIHDGLITYKGLPAPHICDYLTREDSKKFYEEGTSFQIGRMDMVANTGTYMDCPFHRYEDGRDLSQIELKEVVNLPGVLINAEYQFAIDASFFQTQNVIGKAVLVYTGWSKHFNTEAYYSGHPYLTKEAAIYLRDAGALLVGIDSHNIDDTSGNSRRVHTILLAAGIFIVEHMTNLASLAGKEFTFSSVPPKIKGMGTFPVRAFASIMSNPTT
jgi:kynurenine formamidase